MHEEHKNIIDFFFSNDIEHLNYHITKEILMILCYLGPESNHIIISPSPLIMGKNREKKAVCLWKLKMWSANGSVKLLRISFSDFTV